MDMYKDIATLPKKGLKTRPYNIGMEKRDLKTRPYNIDMEKKDLKKLTEGQLIKLLMNQQKEPTPPPRTGKRERVKPKPIPRKSVNEDPTLPPPEQFQDGYKPIPKPRTDRPLQIPKIKELNKALKGHAKSYGIELQDNLNPLNHFIKTKALVESHLENLLKYMKGFKFIEMLEVTFEKDNIDSKTGKRISIYKTAFYNGKAKTITKPNDIEPELSMSRQEILNVIDKWVSEGSGWVIDRIDSRYINVTLYKPLNGSSYIELPMELRKPEKGLINTKNKDDECFRWCHIRHLNPQTEHPDRIKKGDKQFIEGLNYEGIEFPYLKNPTIKSKNRTASESTCLVMKKDNHFPFTFLKKSLKTK